MGRASASTLKKAHARLTPKSRRQCGEIRDEGVTAAGSRAAASGDVRWWEGSTWVRHKTPLDVTLP